LQPLVAARTGEAVSGEITSTATSGTNANRGIRST
jgi:hypothetical protein